MPEKAQSFRDVVAWRKAHACALATYCCADQFPQHEVFALTAQLRRAAVSFASNFVEGFWKRSKPDQLRCLNIAQGSANECLYQLILALDRRYADTATLQDGVEEVSRLLQGSINRMERGGA